MSKVNENCLQDLTKLSGPAATVLLFDDLHLSTFFAVVGPVSILNNMRSRLISTKPVRDTVKRIMMAPWFPAGCAKCHEMALYGLKVRLWEMSESRYDETLHILTHIKQWKDPIRRPQDVDGAELCSVRNLGSFYNLFYPGLLAKLR